MLEFRCLITEVHRIVLFFPSDSVATAFDIPIAFYISTAFYIAIAFKVAMTAFKIATVFDTSILTVRGMLIESVLITLFTTLVTLSICMFICMNISAFVFVFGFRFGLCHFLDGLSIGGQHFLDFL